MKCVICRRPLTQTIATEGMASAMKHFSDKYWQQQEIELEHVINLECFVVIDCTVSQNRTSNVKPNKPRWIFLGRWQAHFVFIQGGKVNSKLSEEVYTNDWDISQTFKFVI